MASTMGHPAIDAGSMSFQVVRPALVTRVGDTSSFPRKILKHSADAHRNGDPDATCSAHLIDSAGVSTNKISKDPARSEPRNCAVVVRAELSAILVTVLKTQHFAEIDAAPLPVPTQP